MKKILFIVEQCNPEWPSVPLVAYNLWNELAQVADVHLITHERNKSALEKKPWEHEKNSNYRKIDYIKEPKWASVYYKIVSHFLGSNSSKWPLFHALTYPIYEAFNYAVYNNYSKSIAHGDYDIVHVFTPVLPRYPVKVFRLARSTKNTKSLEKNSKTGSNAKTIFILGPVNGGLPYPNGFNDIRKKEGGNFNFLRKLTLLIPDYKRTYTFADRIYSGSLYTKNFLKMSFPSVNSQIKLFHENGLNHSFFKNYTKYNNTISDKDESNNTYKRQIQQTIPQPVVPLRLLFVGRLVAYKGVHFLLDAVAKYILKKEKEDSQSNYYNDTNANHYKRKVNYVTLTIVGDGPELLNLELQAKNLGIENYVHFIGQQKTQNIAQFYKNADIFVFLSIREFGGAVVLEAMASGLACIVVNYGGIGEYIDDSCGIRIKPLSSDYIVTETVAALIRLDSNPKMISTLGKNAHAKAKIFLWSTKAKWLMKEYENIIHQKGYNKQ